MDEPIIITPNTFNEKCLNNIAYQTKHVCKTGSAPEHFAVADLGGCEYFVLHKTIDGEEDSVNIVDHLKNVSLEDASRKADSHMAQRLLSREFKYSFLPPNVKGCLNSGDYEGEKKCLKETSPWTFGSNTFSAMEEAYARAEKKVLGFLATQNQAQLEWGEEIAASAVDLAQDIAYSILAARRLTKVRKLADAPLEAVYIRAIHDGIRDGSGFVQMGCIYRRLGEDMMKRIGSAVAADMAMELPEAKRLKQAYDSMRRGL